MTRRLGEDRSPWLCYWIDLDGRQRSRTCGIGEAGRLRAEEMKARVDSECLLRLQSDVRGVRGKGMAAVKEEVVRQLYGQPVVYFVEAVGLERVKIGTTTDLEQRLRDLANYSPVRLKVLLLVAGDVEVETLFHRQFRAFRLHGEWFQMAAPVCKSLHRMREVHRQRAAPQNGTIPTVLPRDNQASDSADEGSRNTLSSHD